MAVSVLGSIWLRLAEKLETSVPASVLCQAFPEGLCHFSYHKDTGNIELRVCPTPAWPHPILLHLWWPYVQKRSQCEVEPLFIGEHRSACGLCRERACLLSRCWKTQLPLPLQNRWNAMPTAGMSLGPHQAKMCQTMRPIILTPFILWNPKLWSTPNASMESGIPDYPCLYFLWRGFFALVTCPHLNTYGFDTSCAISAVLGMHPSFLPSGLSLSQFLWSLTCIQKGFSITHVDLFFSYQSLIQNTNTLRLER